MTISSPRIEENCDTERQNMVSMREVFFRKIVILNTKTWVCTHQKQLRVDLYQGLSDAL